MRTLTCLATLFALGLALTVHAAKVGIVESKASKAPAKISVRAIKPQPDLPTFSVASVPTTPGLTDAR